MKTFSFIVFITLVLLSFSGLIYGTITQNITILACSLTSLLAMSITANYKDSLKNDNK